jgi:hypothetical protein
VAQFGSAIVLGTIGRVFKSHRLELLEYGQVVRHRFLVPKIKGSIPFAPIKLKKFLFFLKLQLFLYKVPFLALSKLEKIKSILHFLLLFKHGAAYFLLVLFLALLKKK